MSECNCYVDQPPDNAPTINYCALHGAAEAMRDALTKAIGFVEGYRELIESELETQDGIPKNWKRRYSLADVCLQDARAVLTAAGAAT